MSVNKILALIGSIFATLFAIFYFFIGFFGGLAIMADYGYNRYDYYSYDTLAPVIGTVFIVLAIVAVAAAIMNWVAFAHLDKEKDKPWKVYFLVMGILSCISFVDLIPGVLFILVFALKTQKTSMAPVYSMAAEEKPEMDNWSWSDTVSEKSAVTPAEPALESQSAEIAEHEETAFSASETGNDNDTDSKKEGE